MIKRRIGKRAVREVPPSEMTASSGSFGDKETFSVKLWHLFWQHFDPASNVLTTNIEKTWNSHCFAPASIVLDLGRPRLITRVELLPDMKPERGLVRHCIELINDGDKYNGGKDNDNVCWCDAVTFGGNGKDKDVYRMNEACNKMGETVRANENDDDCIQNHLDENSLLFKSISNSSSIEYWYHGQAANYEWICIVMGVANFKASQIRISTTLSPSWVAWRQIRVVEMD